MSSRSGSLVTPLRLNTTIRPLSYLGIRWRTARTEGGMTISVVPSGAAPGAGEALYADTPAMSANITPMVRREWERGLSVIRFLVFALWFSIVRPLPTYGLEHVLSSGQVPHQSLVRKQME